MLYFTGLHSLVYTLLHLVIIIIIASNDQKL